MRGDSNRGRGQRTFEGGCQRCAALRTDGTLSKKRLGRKETCKGGPILMAGMEQWDKRRKGRFPAECSFHSPSPKGPSWINNMSAKDALRICIGPPPQRRSHRLRARAPGKARYPSREREDTRKPRMAQATLPRGALGPLLGCDDAALSKLPTGAFSPS